MSQPTIAQINLAGRLFSMSLAANYVPSEHRAGKNGPHTAESDCLEALGNKVRHAAYRRALRQLERLNTYPGELRTDLECLEVAMRLKP